MNQPVALITGSGKKRVGAVVASELAKRSYRLAIHYRTSKAEAEATAKELRQFAPQVEIYQADLGSESDVSTMVQQVIHDFGRIDLLVNTAAIWKSKSLEETKASDVEEHFRTNTLGTFLCCQHVGLQMVKQSGGGVIVNFGDWAEIRPYLNYAAYFPSKGAINTLTRTFAVELATRNPKVRVNAILPGPVMLPPEMSDEEKQQVVNATLVKREGSPMNVAQAVLMFVENDFLTGVLLPVDGGRTVFAPEDAATS